jgi:protein-S-isoprenylcysteine O-methyltransferase Ste14
MKPDRPSTVAIRVAPLVSVKLAGMMRDSVVDVGHFLFGYRDYLFPLVFLLLVLATRPDVPFGSERLDWWMDILGIGMALIGQGWRMLAVGAIENIRRGGRQKRIAADRLIRTGLFAHSRNPLYLGNLLIIGGLVCVADCRWWYLCVFPGFLGVYYAMILAEEDFLMRKFAQEYVDYCRRVNRLVPTFKGLRSLLAQCSFDWKRAIRKECGVICSWGALSIALLVWKLWKRYGYTARKTEIQELLLLLLVLLIVYGGMLCLKIHGRLRS